MAAWRGRLRDEGSWLKLRSHPGWEEWGVGSGEWGGGYINRNLLSDVKLRDREAAGLGSTQGEQRRPFQRPRQAPPHPTAPHRSPPHHPAQPHHATPSHTTPQPTTRGGALALPLHQCGVVWCDWDLTLRYSAGGFMAVGCVSQSVGFGFPPPAKVWNELNIESLTSCSARLFRP